MQNLRPKKSLGQNFLIDKNIAAKIINTAQVLPNDVVVEIGAGYGALTEGFLATGAEVYAVEIDKRLCQVLDQKFGNRKNFSLLEADILKLELKRLKLRKKAILIGNVPFYISSQIIAKFLPKQDFIKKFFVTIQRELAQRLITPSGSRNCSAFSLYVEFFSIPKILFGIKRTCFRPAPGVDAAFLEFILRRKLEIPGIDTKMLFFLIRCAFRHRRKTLFNALRKSFDTDKLKKAFCLSEIKSLSRPENLKLDEYISLMQNLKKI